MLEVIETCPDGFVVRKPEGEPSPSLSDVPPPCHAHTLAICRVADRWASTSLNAGLGLVLAECPGGLYVPGRLISFDFVQRTLSGKRIPATYLHAGPISSMEIHISSADALLNGCPA